MTSISQVYNSNTNLQVNALNCFFTVDTLTPSQMNFHNHIKQTFEDHLIQRKIKELKPSNYSDIMTMMSMKVFGRFDQVSSNSKLPHEYKFIIALLALKQYIEFCAQCMKLSTKVFIHRHIFNSTGVKLKQKTVSKTKNIQQLKSMVRTITDKTKLKTPIKNVKDVHYFKNVTIDKTGEVVPMYFDRKLNANLSNLETFQDLQNLLQTLNGDFESMKVGFISRRSPVLTNCIEQAPESISFTRGDKTCKISIKTIRERFSVYHMGRFHQKMTDELKKIETYEDFNKLDNMFPAAATFKNSKGFIIKRGADRATDTCILKYSDKNYSCQVTNLHSHFALVRIDK